MIKDVELSKTLNADFQKWEMKKKLPFEVSIQVLTSGNWSNDSSSISCIIPPILKQPIDVFTDFYMRKFNCSSTNIKEKKFGRVLTWKLNFGNFDIFAQFDKRYEINVTGFQMMILMMFNENRYLTMN